MLITKNAQGQLVIDQELLNSLPVKGGNYEAFGAGETLQINPTDQTRKVGTVEVPVLNVGGRMVALNTLLGFVADNPQVDLEIANPNLPYQCFKRSAKHTTLRDVVKQNGGILPSAIRVTRRIPQGAGKEFLQDTEKGPHRRNAYTQMGVPVDSLEHFPFIMLRKKGADLSDAKNWKTIDEIVVVAA